MNRLPSAGHARRDAANGASLLAWGVAFAVLAVPSVGTAVFPVDSFAGAAAWLAWYHLLFFWVTICTCFFVLYTVTGAPLAAEMASISIACLHGVYATAVSASVFGDGFATRPADVPWGAPHGPVIDLYIRSELMYFATDTIVLLGFYKKFEFAFFAHHVICAGTLVVILMYGNGSMGYFVMVFGVWAEITNPAQQIFWIVSHVQYNTGCNVTPLQHGVTTALGSIWVVTFAVARVICGIFVGYAVRHIFTDAMGHNVPLWCALLVGPIIVLHASYEMIRDMSGGILAGRDHAFGPIGQPPKTKKMD